MRYCTVCNELSYSNSKTKPLCPECLRRREWAVSKVAELKPLMDEQTKIIYTKLLRSRQKLLLSTLQYKTGLARSTISRRLKLLLKHKIINKDNKHLYYV